MTIQIIVDIKSEVMPGFRFSGGSRSRIMRGTEVEKEQSVKERYRNQLKKYYSKVIDKIKDADLIFIIGPGQVAAMFKDIFRF